MKENDTTSTSKPMRVLFVCLGNICRSPAAEGSFLYIVQQSHKSAAFEIDSAGTAAYHKGELPHPLTREAAAKAGIRLTHASRPICVNDFIKFDYMFAMDRSNYEDLIDTSKNIDGKRVKLFMFRAFDPLLFKKPLIESMFDFAPPQTKNLNILNQIEDVPDPYYGGSDGFDKVQAMVMRTSQVIYTYLNSIIESAK